MVPPAHSPVSEQSSFSYDIVMPDAGGSVSQLPTTELTKALPRMGLCAPGLTAADPTSQVTSAPDASSS
eukprot:10017282-Prorocentrum_lima.AAC.1